MSIRIKKYFLRFWGVAILSFFLTLHSCKVSYKFNDASIPLEAKTCSVAYFRNDATLANPTLTQTLTEAMKDIISSQSKLSLVDKGGDLMFEGNITGYSVTPVAVQSNDQAALNRLTISVSVKYSNTFDEKKNFENTFSRYADFQSSQSLSSVESSLITEINKQLTEDIFNKAFNNW